MTELMIWGILGFVLGTLFGHWAGLWEGRHQVLHSWVRSERERAQRWSPDRQGKAADVIANLGAAKVRRTK